MIKKTLTYEDYNGNKVTKDFWFHINKAEAAKFRFSKDGTDIVDGLSKIMSAENMNVRYILDMFEDLVRMGIGRKSEDGSRFQKSDEIAAELFETEAYSEIFGEMIEDADFAAKFISGMLPKDLAESFNKAQSENDVKNMTREELAQKMRELQEQQKKLEG